MSKEPASLSSLLEDIRALIEDTRRQTATAVNAGLTLLYWRIGRRIRTDVLAGGRAAYGGQVVVTLSLQLTSEYGRSFSDKNLRHMMRFSEVFPEEEIVYALSRQLTWTHFRVLMYLDKPYQRDFYTEMCRIEGWTTRDLRERIDSMLYERTALSKQPDQLIRQELTALRSQGAVTPALVLKDPYVLDFLNLNDRFMEKDLEDAILREIETFLLELGAGFSFVDRQKRIQLNSGDFYIDLLLFNRKLGRLVVVELKLGEFKPEYKGQMELYLRWLDKYEREPGEASPLGIIMCAQKDEDQIELLELGASGIHVAEYLTVLPARELMRRKLHTAIEVARARFDPKKLSNDAEDK